MTIVYKTYTVGILLTGIRIRIDTTYSRERRGLHDFTLDNPQSDTSRARAERTRL